MARRIAYLALKWVGALSLVGVGAWGINEISKLTHFQVTGSIVDRVETREKVVALTFDDGPSLPYTEQILEVLARHGVRATFFMVGKNIERRPEVARKVFKAGHQIGNHSYAHERLVLRSTEFMKDEIERTDALIRKIGFSGDIPFRAPHGRKLIRLPVLLQEMGKTHVLFDVQPTPGDSMRPPAQALAQDVLSRTRPGSIIVLHDGGGVRDETVQATDIIVRTLHDRGYRLVTVVELMHLASRPNHIPEAPGPRVSSLGTHPPLSIPVPVRQ